MGFRYFHAENAIERVVGEWQSRYVADDAFDPRNGKGGFTQIQGDNRREAIRQESGKVAVPGPDVEDVSTVRREQPKKIFRPLPLSFRPSILFDVHRLAVACGDSSRLAGACGQSARLLPTLSDRGLAPQPQRHKSAVTRRVAAVCDRLAGLLPTGRRAPGNLLAGGLDSPPHREALPAVGAEPLACVRGCKPRRGGRTC